MRIPETVLNNLATKSNSDYVYERLYRNLFNRDLFLKAYANIYAKEGNMTAGADGKTVDGMSLERIDRLMNSLRDESYSPTPVRRVFIKKKNSNKLRPLGVPSFDDKLVQEVVRMMLESIFEGSFANSSHGFRPNRSCLTALMQIQTTFTGVKWFVEGDIKGFFDNIDHQILIGLLRKRIRDERFINLIWKFLKAGYIEDWKFHNTYSGTPQGSIVSPILSNIYLSELDEYMEEFSKTFNSGSNRKSNPAYRQLVSKVFRRRKKLKDNTDISDSEKQTLLNEIRVLSKQLVSTDCLEPMDANYKRIRYVRYADDFLIGIIGSKEDAREVKRALTDFLREKIGLELSQEKTLITSSKDKAKFLGYHIFVSRDQNLVKDKNGIAKRNYNSVVRLEVPSKVWVDKLKSLKAIKFKENGRDMTSIHRGYLEGNDDLEILRMYNAEIRGLYNYYKLANNVSTLNRFYYFMRFSMYKTFAHKYKSTMSQIITKYSMNGTFGVKYSTAKGEKVAYLYSGGFRKDRTAIEDPMVDELPNVAQFSSRNSLITRLLASHCEWCGGDNVPLEIHHVRKLKDLKGKALWERVMIQRRRKTMALSTKCHDDLHNGKLS